MRLLAAATFVMAEPIDQKRWLSADDYPIGAMRAELDGGVRFALIVGRDGHPLRCEPIIPDKTGTFVRLASPARSS